MLIKLFIPILLFLLSGCSTITYKIYEDSFLDAEEKVIYRTIFIDIKGNGIKKLEKLIELDQNVK